MIFLFETESIFKDNVQSLHFMGGETEACQNNVNCHIVICQGWYQNPVPSPSPMLFILLFFTHLAYGLVYLQVKGRLSKKGKRTSARPSGRSTVGHGVYAWCFLFGPRSSLFSLNSFFATSLFGKAQSFYAPKTPVCRCQGIDSAWRSMWCFV